MWWGPNTSLEGVGSSSITSSPAKGHRGQSPLRVFSFRLPFSLLEPSKASAERHLKLRKILPPPEHRPSLECLLNTPPHPRLGSGEGNGNPLQYSCLENPRDRGAWCAAVCGVAQSRTRLTRLSSSSSRLDSPHHTKGEEFPPSWIVLANAQGGRPQLRTSKPFPLPGGESYSGECPESGPRRVPSSGVYFLQRLLGHPS